MHHARSCKTNFVCFWIQSILIQCRGLFKPCNSTTTWTHLCHSHRMDGRCRICRRSSRKSINCSSFLHSFTRLKNACFIKTVATAKWETNACLLTENLILEPLIHRLRKTWWICCCKERLRSTKSRSTSAKPQPSRMTKTLTLILHQVTTPALNF